MASRSRQLQVHSPFSAVDSSQATSSLQDGLSPCPTPYLAVFSHELIGYADKCFAGSHDLKASSLRTANDIIRLNNNKVLCYSCMSEKKGHLGNPVCLSDFYLPEQKLAKLIRRSVKTTS
ncbi:hypothetical protein FPOAC2_02047 [Fusarium poae]|jgi:hypothetical protein